MFDEFRLNRRIRKLQRKRDRALVAPTEELEAAKKTKDENAIGSVLAECSFISEEYDDEIGWLVTRHLREKVERLMLPLPEWSDEKRWRESRWDRGRLLTHLGMTEVRTLIRDHERHEREQMAFWISSIVGVLGAISGVLGLLIAYAALK